MDAPEEDEDTPDWLVLFHDPEERAEALARCYSQARKEEAFFVDRISKWEARLIVVAKEEERDEWEQKVIEDSLANCKRLREVVGKRLAEISKEQHGERQRKPSQME